MNTIETPEAAARRLFRTLLAQGFELTAVYEYRVDDESVWAWRARFEREGEKTIRPMHLSENGLVAGEPPAPVSGKPLYGLRALRASEPGDLVYLVEGEKCAEALQCHGLCAITSGGSTSVATADWRPCANRKVMVWPDNDEPGLGFAEAARHKLHELGCEVAIIDPRLLGLPNGGDCVDWFALNPTADFRELPKFELVPEPARELAPAPESLRRSMAPAAPYPVEALGIHMGAACRSLVRVIQAPTAVCAASLLAAASLAVQGLRNIANDGREHPATLWFLTIADSGERKSAVDSEAMRAAREFEKSLHVDYCDQLPAYDAKLEEWNALRDAAKAKAKKSFGVGLADALRKIGPPPALPVQPALIAADFTAEGLAKFLGAGRPSMGAFTDEAALVLGGHGMSREAVSRTAASLSKLWDSGMLDRLRASDGMLKLWGRRLALHLMAQPVIAEAALSNDVLSGQGFLARCLMAWPASTAGNRPYKSENLRTDPALGAFYRRILRLFNTPLPLAPGKANELDPPALTLSDDAFSRWRAFHDEIEVHMGVNGDYASCKPWASKTPEQSLRIAAVLTVFETPDAMVVTEDTMARAVEIATWHLREAMRLSGTAAISAETRDAEALLDWCHESGRTQIYSTVVLQYGPLRIREAATFRAAIEELSRLGWARPVPGGAHLDGAMRRHVWNIVHR